MSKTKEILITGFALFSMFFGAGNLILPPFLGFHSGLSWWLVALGFILSAVIIPLLGIFAHARLQGTMLDFGNKVSPVFSLIYCIVVYMISVGLPAPRTASVTHEMAIQPYFETSSLLTSNIYFAFVLVFVLNRHKILDLIGKFLTPFIILLLLIIIGITITSATQEINPTSFPNPFISGLLEGYQTFDAIGAVVVGGVILISLKINTKRTVAETRALVARSGMVAGAGLLLIYTGLIFSGALLNTSFSDNVSRTELLSGMSFVSLGHIGRSFLSVLIALACFTTAVGIITGTSDFVKGLFHNSQRAYVVTAIFGSLLGVVMGQLEVNYIIAVAIPALLLIYPVTIALILLNCLPEKFASPMVFKSVIAVTILFSLPDFLVSLGFTGIKNIQEAIPLWEFHLGWLLPAIALFVLVNLLKTKERPF